MDMLQNQIPGYSMRMQEVTAAMLTPQIARLPVIKDIHVRNWNLLHSLINDHPNIEIPMPLPQVDSFATPCSSILWACLAMMPIVSSTS